MKQNCTGKEKDSIRNDRKITTILYGVQGRSPGRRRQVRRKAFPEDSPVGKKKCPNWNHYVIYRQMTEQRLINYLQTTVEALKNKVGI